MILLKFLCLCRLSGTYLFRLGIYGIILAIIWTSQHDNDNAHDDQLDYASVAAYTVGITVAAHSAQFRPQGFQLG